VSRGFHEGLRQRSANAGARAADAARRERDASERDRRADARDRRARSRDRAIDSTPPSWLVDVALDRRRAADDRGCSAADRVRAAADRDAAEGEAERERLLNQLHEVRRLESLGELTGGIAHDFNNLLAVIINYSAFVAKAVGVERRRYTDDGLRATREDVEQISKAAEQAARLTGQLRTFARHEVVFAEPVDANTVVRALMAMLADTPGWPIDLRCALAPDLKPIMIDVATLERVLVSLAVDARDAMSEAGTITIDTANLDLGELDTELGGDLSPGPYVRLRVSDDGHRSSEEGVGSPFTALFPAARQASAG
jgi:signal transduction histidine kinase